MARTFKRTIWFEIWLCLLLIDAASGALAAQGSRGENELAITTSDFDDGGMVEFKESIAKLIRFRLNEDDGLALDRESWEGSILSPEDRKVAMINSLIKRGLTPDRAKDHAERSFQREAEMAERMKDSGHRTEADKPNPVFELADDIANSIGISGRSGGGGGGRLQYQYRGKEFAIGVGLNDPALRLSVTEIVDKNRSLVVTEDEKKVGIVLYSDDAFLRLIQSTDGSIRVTLVFDTDVFNSSASNFSEFSEQHPEQLAEIYRVLGNVGCDLPPLKHHSSVMQQARTILMLKNGVPNEEFSAWLDQLKSDQYSAREEAKKLIQENFDTCSKEIEVQLANGDLTSQQSAMLNAIQTENKWVESRESMMLEAHGLLRDVEYLNSLLADATPEGRVAIEKQIANLRKSSSDE